MQKITPFLWFNNQSEEAAQYYCSVFPNSSIGTTSRYDEASAKASGQPVGSALVVTFTLNGQPFNALNGGPTFTFSEAVSFMVTCENQEEIDYYWNNLSAVPESEQCGWCKDKFGLSWQIVPKNMSDLISGPDKEKSSRAMQAMMQMKKIDIEALQNA